MKVALLGCGKTGQYFKELAPFKVTVFNTKNPITEEALKGHNLIVSFLPGHIFQDYLELLLKTKIPVISGSTGFHYPPEFQERLKKENCTWIQANNFSIGMNIIKNLLQTLSKLTLPSHFKYELKETHHTQKKDAPSGTALRWQEWFEHEVSITSLREGDEIGFHQLSLFSDTEEIVISHQAKSRALFAEGAIFACQNFEHFQIEYGLHHFDQIIDSYLKRG